MVTRSRSVFLVLLCCVYVSSAHFHASPNVKDLITGVELDGGRVRRQASREPLRIVAVYDASVDTALDPTKAEMLRTETMPKAIQFFEASLSVNRVQAPLVFDRACEGGSFFPTTGLGPRGCVTTCSAATVCGEISIPNEHLKDCIQCNGQGSNSCENLNNGGAGVSNADVVLYVSAIDTQCPPATQSDAAQTVAFASFCQLESSLDRPIAGNVNFCPLGVAGNAADFVLELTKHEITHALGFASSLFAFWRNPDGTVRTARDSSGQPTNFNMEQGFFTPSSNTVQFGVTYNDWTTIDGTVPHTVTHLVTSAVVREARAHFNCPTLTGVELENQGGSGTMFSHWEKRILGNEAMTGVLTFNPVFSRISLATFEDSGWYDVNYDMAGDLAWGREAGCDFATGSCLEWINTREGQGLSTAPFCTDTARGCTVDHEALGACNRVTFDGNLPTQFQYFTERDQGGSVTIADYCPFHNSFTLMETSGRVRGTDCSVPDNLPTDNAFAESYGSGSRCLQHGTRLWSNTRNGQTFSFSTRVSGCYQYACSPSTGVTVVIGNRAYQCSCEGEEIRFTFADDGVTFTGSFICPACSQICYDNLISCPDVEPARCSGMVTNSQGSTDLPPRVTTTQGGGGSGGAVGTTAVVVTITTGLLLALI